MKIQKLTLIVLIFSFLLSCEKDNETAPLAESSISGKFLAPNDTDPIVNGLITASKDGTVVSETLTATDGTFTLTNLTAGEYTVTLKKGLFSSERTVEVAEDDDIDIPNIPIETFPRIGVVTGAYDHIESVLYNIGLVNPFTQEPLFDIIQKAKDLGQKLILTTDHGTINCKTPTKVIGDKNISSNLRYKTGRSLTYEEKDVYAVANPKDIFLPSLAINSPFIFAKEDLFFAYPNNFNHFVKYYKNTYQHGGVSLEEMIIPCTIYNPK